MVSKKENYSSEKASYLSDQYWQSFGQLIDLSDSQKNKLEKKLHSEIDDWKSSTSALHEKLSLWNDIVENVVDETDYPFEGCSNIHVPLAAIYLKIYHSFTRRSILGTES